MQVVADGKLANYESEIKHLTAGCSVTVEGEVKESPAKGQATEVHASGIIVHGLADAETYPLQKKGHSFEFLRTIAHLRPRTNTFGAIARLRNQVSRSIHEFFQENGFLYIHAPIITASDCEGAGEMFRVTTLELDKLPKATSREWCNVDFAQDFFHAPGVSHRQRPAQRRNLRLLAGQGLHLRPDVPRRKQQHLAAPGRVLDGRARDGVLRAHRQHGPGRGVPQTHLPRRAGRNAAEDMQFFKERIDNTVIDTLEQIIASEFVRLPYTEAVERLEKSGKQFEFPVAWGKDLQAEHERYLTEEVFKRPVILFDYPRIDQAVLHARQRRRADRPRDGHPRARKSARSSAAASAKSGSTCSSRG